MQGIMGVSRDNNLPSSLLALYIRFNFSSSLIKSPFPYS